MDKEDWEFFNKLKWNLQRVIMREDDRIILLMQLKEWENCKKRGEKRNGKERSN